MLFPGRVHLVGVAQAAAGTVVGSQCPVQVLILPVQIKAQNVTALTKIGESVSQVVVASPNLVFPEWHDLHQALCPGARDGEAIKGALHLDHRQHQLGWQIELARLLVNPC